MHEGVHKWNHSHSWLINNLVSSIHYQGEKWGKQIESGCGTGITNQRKCGWNSFQYLKCKLNELSPKKLGEGGESLKTPPPHTSTFSFQFRFYSCPLRHPLRSAEKSLITLNLLRLHVFPLYLSNFNKCCSIIFINLLYS